MYCRNCGAKLEDGALFCRKCGTSVLAEGEKPSALTGRSAAKKGSEQSVFLDRGAEKKKPEKPAAADRPPKRETPAVPADPEPFPEDFPVRKTPKRRRLNKRGRLIVIGAAALLLIVLTVVIVSVTSCKKPERFTSPEAVQNAVIAALEQGDGARLSGMAKVSEPVLGRHPETYGDGSTPEAVMRGYYDRLAGGLFERLSERYGSGFRLEAATETRLVTGTEIFEPNRTLNIEAERYAEITGTLSVNGETVGNIRIVAAELDGEWKLLIVYVW